MKLALNGNTRNFIAIGVTKVINRGWVDEPDLELAVDAIRPSCEARSHAKDYE